MNLAVLSSTVLNFLDIPVVEQKKYYWLKSNKYWSEKSIWKIDLAHWDQKGYFPDGQGT